MAAQMSGLGRAASPGSRSDTVPSRSSSDSSPCSRFRRAASVFQSVAITGILALGVVCTLVVRGFDLSTGPVAASVPMLSAYVMVVLE